MGRVTARWGFFSCDPKIPREIVGSSFASPKIDMRKKSWPTSILALIVSLCFLLAGCGKGYPDKDGVQEEEAIAQYHAPLKPLNTKFGTYSGKLSITIMDNQFWARMMFHGPRTGYMNAQYIHFGHRCPTMNDDTNRDGYLDFMEAHAVVGDILIPLDTVLETQLKGMNLFPKLKRNNSFYYSEAANFARMMSDLRAEDLFPNDMMGKLDGDNLDLAARVVLVYGVSEERNLPVSVSSFNGYPNQASLPIACGVITERAE